MSEYQLPGSGGFKKSKLTLFPSEYIPAECVAADNGPQRALASLEASEALVS